MNKPDIDELFNIIEFRAKTVYRDIKWVKKLINESPPENFKDLMNKDAAILSVTKTLLLSNGVLLNYIIEWLEEYKKETIEDKETRIEIEEFWTLARGAKLAAEDAYNAIENADYSWEEPALTNDEIKPNKDLLNRSIDIILDTFQHTASNVLSTSMY